MTDDQPKKDAQILVVQFLVPVYGRDGKPYRRSVHKKIRRDLEDRFDSWSLAADKPLPGAWRNPTSGDVEYDDSCATRSGSTQGASSAVSASTPYG